jgi:hypothetical protein
MLYYVRLAAFRRKARENLLSQPGFRQINICCFE